MRKWSGGRGGGEGGGGGGERKSMGMEREIGRRRRCRLSAGGPFLFVRARTMVMRSGRGGTLLTMRRAERTPWPSFFI